MVIIIQCEDRVGLVAAISTALAKEKCNIVSTREHVDKAENMFFMRVEVEQCLDAASLERKIYDVLPEHANVSVNPLPSKKIIVMVTKEHHCLADRSEEHTSELHP